MPVCSPTPTDNSPFPTPLCARYPYSMDSRKSAQQPLQRRRGAPLGSQNARLPILNFAPKLVLSLSKDLNCFPYFQQSGSRLALQLDITLETIPLLRHTTTPPLNAILRLLTVFRTPQKPLMSSGQPSPRPPASPPCPFTRLSVCPHVTSCPFAPSPYIIQPSHRTEGG